jgi:AhpD family alkylhydroperoxidase
MMAKQETKGMDMVREYSLKYYGRIDDTYERFGRYLPEAMTKWIELRKSLFREPPKGALTLREKELIGVAIQVATRKPNVDLHTRKAMEAGATVKQIAEVTGLCILLAGMMTYVESGKNALAFAEEYAKKMKGQGKAKGRRRAGK